MPKDPTTRLMRRSPTSIRRIINDAIRPGARPNRQRVPAASHPKRKSKSSHSLSPYPFRQVRGGSS